VFDKVAALPPLKEVIVASELHATKSLGQNFLLDLNLTRKIARTAGITANDTIIEIGPGPGGLTRGLFLEGARQVHAIEFDERAICALESLMNVTEGNLFLYHRDALSTDMLQFGIDGHRKIVANLPYNIATPLLINWLRQIEDKAVDAYQNITIMVQKEVARRIVAPCGSKLYGRLSVLCQWLCDCRSCFDVPASAFVPPPKVTSSVVQLIPRRRMDRAKFELIEKLTATAFGQRRKTIRQSLKAYKPLIKDFGLDDNLRAENLSVSDYVRLAEAMEGRTDIILSRT